MHDFSGDHAAAALHALKTRAILTVTLTFMTFYLRLSQKSILDGSILKCSFQTNRASLFPEKWLYTHFRISPLVKNSKKRDLSLLCTDHIAVNMYYCSSGNKNPKL